MGKITKSERKKAFFGILSPYLESLGYSKYLDGDAPTFVLRNGNVVVSFYFNFFSNGGIGVGSLFLSDYDVENYILKIGIPTNKLIEQSKREKDHLPTVSFRKLPKSLDERSLNSIDEVETFANSFIKFYKSECIEFISKYSYLPNILRELNLLDKEGKNWKDLVFGMGDVFIRVLIISKLCNDPKYDEKFDKINNMIQGANDWLPYWVKYKEVLENIKPKYNLT